MMSNRFHKMLYFELSTQNTRFTKHFLICLDLIDVACGVLVLSYTCLQFSHEVGCVNKEIVNYLFAPFSSYKRKICCLTTPAIDCI